ncbi:uncharacterized protein LOC120443624 isoform X2 [Oreochromis aureus]|uniref:uncharacterized protein LOC120443624 isoform X2 n=1 Tax=Oreochromis aureus TaxID=47969 RepID=UPI0019536075|nr:uncharacterized protein LOC120443624 isoform X2 [Oreochromis aureus]
MDSADSAASIPTLATLAAMLERHEQMFIHLRGELANLTQAVAQRTPLLATPPAAAPLQEASASAFKGVFDRKSTTLTASQRLLALKQDALMTLCVWLDDRVRAHTRTGQESLDYHRTSPAGRGPRDSNICDEEEPMQLGHSRLTPAERQRRLATGQAGALQPAVPSHQGPAAPPARGWSAGLRHHPHHGLPAPGQVDWEGYWEGTVMVPVPAQLASQGYTCVLLSLSLSPTSLPGRSSLLAPPAELTAGPARGSHTCWRSADSRLLFEAGPQIFSSLDDCATDVSLSSQLPWSCTFTPYIRDL